mgnify:CR=1 FL=1
MAIGEASDGALCALDADRQVRGCVLRYRKRVPDIGEVVHFEVERRVVESDADRVVEEVVDLARKRGIGEAIGVYGCDGCDEIELGYRRGVGLCLDVESGLYGGMDIDGGVDGFSQGCIEVARFSSHIDIVSAQGEFTEFFEIEFAVRRQIEVVYADLVIGNVDAPSDVARESGVHVFDLNARFVFEPWMFGMDADMWRGEVATRIEFDGSNDIVSLVDGRRHPRGIELVAA